MDFSKKCPLFSDVVGAGDFLKINDAGTVIEGTETLTLDTAGISATPDATGFHIDGGTSTTKRITVGADLSVSGATTISAPASISAATSITGALTVSGASTITGAVVHQSDYDANTILAANSDNTPAALTIAEQRILGRITGGNIAGLTSAQVLGMLLASTVAGDVPYFSDTAVLARLAKGTAYQKLQMNSGATAPEWVDGETAWADYFTTSTKTGWAANPTGNIFYKKIGKIVFVEFNITGTSNATNAVFTVPYTNSGTYAGSALTGAVNAGSDITTACRSVLANNDNQVACYTNMAAGAWTNSGTKTIIGSFWYNVA